MTEKEPFFIWTVYDRPTDFPDSFVARRFEVTAQGVRATETFLIGHDLDLIREQLIAWGLFRLARHDVDDTNIVESWI